MLNSNECYVLRKGNEYLVGCPYDDTTFARFSISPYDGYPFNEFMAAWSLARRINGVVMKHNRTTGKIEGGWK